MTVGENIRHARTGKGLTQKELGAKLGGISQQQIGQWETGKARPKLETLQKIADALDIDVLYLLCINEHDIETINIKNKLVGTPHKKPDYANLPERDYSLGFEDWLHYNKVDFIYWDIGDEKGWMMKFIDTDEMFFLSEEQAAQIPQLSIEHTKLLIRTLGQRRK